MPLRIRRATLADLATVRSLLIDTWHATYDPWIGPDAVAEVTARWHSPARLQRELALDGAMFLVAEAVAEPPPGMRHGALLGTAFGYTETETTRDDRAAPETAAPLETDADMPRLPRPPAAGSGAATADAAGSASTTGNPHPRWRGLGGPSPMRDAGLRPAHARPVETPTPYPAAGSAAAIATGRIEIGRLYVAPERQGDGVGTRLLTALCQSFPEARHFRLDVDPRNARAIRFYERHGFAVTDRGEDCGGSGLPHLVMERWM